MFLLPAFALPFLLFFAIRRLVRIPRGLLQGRLRVPEHRRRMLGVLGTVAYACLLGSTIALVVALSRVALASHDALSAYLSVGAYVLAYPLVYLVAEWIFYYAFKESPEAAPAQSRP